MPQRRNAIKALRINRKRHSSNLKIKTDLKKTIKRFKLLVSDKNVKEAQTLLPILHKKVDKAAKRDILHRNTAARRKSSFSRLLLSIVKPMSSQGTGIA